MFSGPGETKVPKKGHRSIMLLGTSLMNCMCGSMDY